MQRRAIIGLAVSMVVGVALWGTVNNTQAYSTDEGLIITANGSNEMLEKSQSAATMPTKLDFLPSPPRVAGVISSAGGPVELTALSRQTTLDGNISAMGVDGLVIDTPDGQVSIEGDAWTFLLGQGFSANLGDSVRLEGFYEKGEYLIGVISRVEGGSVVRVRDATGQLVRGVGR